MSVVKITNDKLREMANIKACEFPKYTTQMINLANQNSQGTRPTVVGQMSELINIFSGNTFLEWKEWYESEHPDAIENAVEKIFRMVGYLKSAMEEIDEKMVRTWVEDLVINKTYTGMRFQKAILERVAECLETSYKIATSDEEAKGINGYIGEQPIAIKPYTFTVMSRLSEQCKYPVIIYRKEKTGITVDFTALENN